MRRTDAPESASGAPLAFVSFFENVRDQGCREEATMHARVSTNRFPPDKLDDGIRYVREQGLRQLQAQDGFRGLYLLVDRESGKALSVSLWESAAALEASEATSATVRTQGTLAAGGTTAPTVTHYEVVIEP
jgi:heme-degrading monooxygenase HmoA